MAAKKPLELFLFTDEPARELSDDHLALKPFSSMIAAAALTNRGPFNIGVFSGWGQGKTTVLRQAQALIEDQEKPNVITAWVNAWQYEHEAHPIVPLLAIIISEITNAIDARKGTHDKENDAFAKTFGDLARTLRSIAYSASFNFKVGLPGAVEIGMGMDAKDAIDRDEKLAAFDTPLVGESLYYEVFKRFEKLCSDLSKGPQPPKIIVFIDDLDRCLPSKALHLLESLKLVLAQPGFIFVLGVDRHVIDSFLTKRYHREFGIRADKGHGRQYMDKIIQLPLDLPHHQNRFEKYIDGLTAKAFHAHQLPAALFEIFSNTEDSARFRSALAAGCDRTPRTLIRTLNYLLTDLFLRDNEFFNLENDPFTSSAEFVQFAAVSRITRITFGSEHERLYRKLVSSNWGCDEVFNLLGGRKNIWSASSDDPEYGYNYPGGEKDFEIARAGLDPFKYIITRTESLSELFRTGLGKSWLKEHEKRQAIEGFLATRDDQSHSPDQNSAEIINARIRLKLGLYEDQEIGDDDRRKITSLNLSGTQVSDLTAISNLTSLQGLNLTGTQVNDITPLNGLIRLQTLLLGRTQVSNITALNSMANLKELSLLGTQVMDLSPLYGMKNCLLQLWIGETPAAEDEASLSILNQALPHTQILV